MLGKNLAMKGIKYSLEKDTIAVLHKNCEGGIFVMASAHVLKGNHLPDILAKKTLAGSRKLLCKFQSWQEQSHKWSITTSIHPKCFRLKVAFR